MRFPPEPADTAIVAPVMPPEPAVDAARQVVLRLAAPGPSETLDRALERVNATPPRRIVSNVDAISALERVA